MMLDLIIVGGGMSGISVGHFFRDKKILLLEKGNLLSGATGNNAGFLIAGFGEHFKRTVSRFGMSMAREIQEMHRSNHRRIRDLSTILKTPYNASGSFSLPLDSKEETELRESLELLKQAGYAVEWRDDPQIGLRKSRGALWNPDDAFIDAPLFWNALARELPVKQATPVLQVQNEKGAIVVKTPGDTYRAQNIVFCLDAFSSELVPELRGRYMPLRGQIVEVAAEHHLPEIPVIAEYGNLYWRFAPGKLIFGGLESEFPQEEAGVATELSTAIEMRQIEWIRANFNVKTDRRISSRFGTMAYTLDGFPFVGALPQPRRFVLAGTCGLGHSYTLEAASWLHSLIAKDRNVTPDYCSSDRIEKMPVHSEGDWRTLYEAWNY